MVANVPSLSVPLVKRGRKQAVLTTASFAALNIVSYSVTLGVMLATRENVRDKNFEV